MASIVVMLLTLVAASAVGAEPKYPEKSWEYAASPEAVGWSTDRLIAAREHTRKLDTSAVIIVAGGVVVQEWGETTKRYNVHSIRKSLLSALYGIHVKEGRVDLGKTLADLGVDDNDPPLTPIEKQATIADLLKARSGIYHPALYETPGARMGRPARGSYRPGTFWYYNNWDFNALGTIFEQATGTKIFEEFKRRIADPLEMEDYRVDDGEYVRGAESVHAAYPFRMTARDLARFGLLYARGGHWRGVPIVPREWVAASTRAHSDLGQAGGYGYMWWTAPNGGPHYTSASFGGAVFSARGWGGHHVVVVPYLDLVIVHRVDTDTPRRFVTDSQFGHLLQLILDAKR